MFFLSNHNLQNRRLTVVSHKKSKYICWLVGLFYVKLIMS